MTLVKICGVKDRHVAIHAMASGADLLGIVMDTPSSPRDCHVVDARAVARVIAGRVKLVIVAKRLSPRLASVARVLRPDFLQVHWSNLGPLM